MAASSSSSADVVASIDDLMLQILSCVPAKPLTRLKLVSKHWESLITTHHASFLRKQGPLGLICPGKRIPSFEFIPFDARNQAQPPFSELRFPGGVLGGLHWISQSCNGLLLCCNAHSNYLDPNFFPRAFYNNKNNSVWGIWFPRLSYCVYNPTKNCFAKIPRPGGYPPKMLGLNLAYDPVKSPCYKILFTYRTAQRFKLEIYSSDSGTWRLYDKPCITMANFNQGVYWNGSMHWINHLDKELLYFNLDNEEFEKVPLPSTLRHNHIGEFPMIGYFGESGDHLHVVEICHENKAVFNLHEMKRDYSGWFVRYQVDLTNTSNIGNDNNTFRIFSLVRGKEGKCRSFLLFFDSLGKFTRWNLDHKTVEEIFENKNIVTEFRILPFAFKYIESLASV